MKNILATFIFLMFMLNIAFAGNNFSNKYYFRYGQSFPMSKYFNDHLIIDFQPEEKRGGSIEIGSLIYFQGLDLGSKAKLGFDINYLSVSKHVLNYYFEFFYIFEPEYIFYNVGSKIGPVFTYNIFDQLNIDLYAKVNPIWVNGSVLKSGKRKLEDGSNSGDMTKEDFLFLLGQEVQKDPYKFHYGTLGLKYNFGLNIRYDFIMIGVDISLGNLKYQSADDKNIYLGRVPNLLGTIEFNDDFSKQTNSPVINLSLGFCF